MKTFDKSDGTAAILILIGFIALAVMFGAVCAWLLLLIWNFFVVAVGSNLVAPVTFKTVIGLMLVISAVRLLIRSCRKQ